MGELDQNKVRECSPLRTSLDILELGTNGLGLGLRTHVSNQIRHCAWSTCTNPRHENAFAHASRPMECVVEPAPTEHIAQKQSTEQTMMLAHCWHETTSPLALFSARPNGHERCKLAQAALMHSSLAWMTRGWAKTPAKVRFVQQLGFACGNLYAKFSLGLRLMHPHGPSIWGPMDGQYWSHA